MKRKVTPATKLRQAKIREAGLSRRLGEVEAKLMIATNVKENLKKIIKDEISLQTNCKETEYYAPKTVVKRLADALITSNLF